jgi:hypothetical protein
MRVLGEHSRSVLRESEVRSLESLSPLAKHTSVWFDSDSGLSTQDLTILMDWTSKSVLDYRGIVGNWSRPGARFGEARPYGLAGAREELLHEIVAEIERDGGKAVPRWPMSRRAGNAWRLITRSKCGPIDLLVANAGVGATNDDPNSMRVRWQSRGYQRDRRCELRGRSDTWDGSSRRGATGRHFQSGCI